MKNLNLKNVKKNSLLSSIAIMSMLFFWVASPVQAAGSTITRSFSSATPAPGSALTVSLAINVLPPDNASPNDFYLIDEVVPTGWTVTSATNSGDFTSQVGHVKWTVLSGATSGTDSYTVTVPATASGVNTFSGQYGFGSTINVVPPPTVLPSILGDTSVTVTAVVNPVLTSINVAPSNSSVIVGGTQQFTATALDQNGTPINPEPAFTWSSSDATIATIDTNGLAFGVILGGPITITATSGLITGTANLSVVAAPPVAVLTTINITPINPTITTAGGTQQFTATTLDQNGAPFSATVSWTSSNVAVATVDATTGLVSALTNGTTTITATSGAISGTTILTVNVPAVVTPPPSNTGGGGGSTGGGSSSGGGYLYGCKDPKAVNYKENFVYSKPELCIYNKITTVEKNVGKVLGAQKYHFTLMLKKGSKGNEVMELQKFLDAAGYDLGSIDGIFGTKTKTAVIKYELANNLKGDGIVGPKVQAILNE